MDSFSMARAWSFGLRFIGPRLAGHILILVGIGILAPFALQFAIAGGANAMISAAAPVDRGALASSLPLMAALAIGYSLQIGSYFASWRLGFGGARPLAGAILYGLGAGLLAVAVVAIVATPALWLAVRLWTPENVLVGALVALISLSAVAALFYTTVAALAAALTALLLIAAMAFGTATGQVGMAATLVGGRGDLVVVLLVMCGVLMWLAGRLSCTAALMAERRSFNLLAAARDSWRLTWEEQWPILRYLALVGFALALLTLGAAVATGAGASALFAESGAPVLRIGTIVVRLLVAVPLAFLSVMVPAGIYRELTRSDISPEIFA